ncbi:MAG TPA: hypothetical protein VMY35_04540 [Phycisphaerae bacterium]|nr:hypothetical protein [Phycisphaerae bacterium]
MADTFITLADLLKVNDAALEPFEISDLVQAVPLLMALPAASTDGNDYKYLKETGAVTVGFREVNVGRDYSASADTLVTATLKLLDASFRVDKALADQFKNGPTAHVAREARRHLKAALFEFEEQIIYGVGNEADGFAGLADNAAYDATTDDMVLDATGTTASTGSSVWLLNAPGDFRGVHAVVGNEGRIDVDETITQEVDDSAGAHYTAYYTPILGWVGLAVGGAYSAARICNLTEDSGKGLTDALIYQAIEMFPVDRQAGLIIVMSRRSRKQLRASRTATNATGVPAPIPNDVDGFPIITVESISNTETLL